MSDDAFALRLARAVADRIRPLMGTANARRRVGTAHGGDPTYAIDAEAETLVREAFAERSDVAYFTEDEGLVVRGSPRRLFLVDPIDGTRPAAAGFETCCVSIAVAPFGAEPALGDVEYGCLVEIATGSVLEARRGAGASGDRAVEPSHARAVRGAFWAGGFRGQPAVLTATVLEEIFDAPGSEGAYFDQGSAAYSLACVATGRLDAYVDVGAAIVDEIPGARAAFEALGDGSILNSVTYDVAAGALLAREAGCAISDPRGRSLAEVPLLAADGSASPVATVCAGTPELHAELLAAVDRGLERARSLS